MGRILPTENILSDDIHNLTRAKKRNYSFQRSKRLPAEKMTPVNGIKVPSMPGSCYHAIIAALAENKDKFCNWEKIISLTEKNMCKYGGKRSWNKFVAKGNVKSYQQRIKDNAHTLTRTGRDCYGYRLHEQGMCIYYFKDGAMLLVDGKFVRNEDTYEVIFADGRHLQTRYRGTTMTYKEYRKFLEKKYIDNSGKVLNPSGIKKLRAENAITEAVFEENNLLVNVCVVLEDSFGQATALRLEKMGLKVEEGLGNELIGTVPRGKVEMIREDPDVCGIEVSGD